MHDRDAAEVAAGLERLFALKPRGAKYGVDRMRLLSAGLGYPERLTPWLHVAGTNGKGSVSAMLDAILHAAGWRTGLYTSPHLVRIGERVQVDRVPLRDEEVLALVDEVRPIADRLAAANADDQPAFFEYMTALAFLHFARRRCDIGVLEVGLGGRLDATNVVTPEVAVITSIAMDHAEILGDTLAKIAREKAGVIKPGVPVVLGRMPAEAEETIRHVAAEKQVRVISVLEEYGPDLARYPHTNLEGDYQRWNAATATLAAKALGARWRVTDAVIDRGLAHVDWPGRWQRVQLGGRCVILDSSHNPEGAAVLDSNLSRLVAETGRAPVVVTGVLGTVRARPLIEAICRHAAELRLIVPRQTRACTYAELEALIPSDFRGRVVRDTVEAIFPRPGECAVGTREDVVVVTGSIYLLGEVMAALGARAVANARVTD